MKALVALTLALPALAFAGAPDYGIGSLIARALFVVLILWILLAFGIACAVTKSWRFRAALTGAATASPFAYLSIQSFLYNRGLDGLQQESRQLASKANSYLLLACEKHRRVFSSRPVTPADGVLVNFNTNQKLDLRDAPPPETETDTMRRNQQRYSESFPIQTHEVQYVMPIDWVFQMHAASIVRESRFDFAEYSDSRSIGTLITTARKDWWLKSGHERVAKERRQDFLRHLRERPELETWGISEKTQTSHAKYLVSVDDISTTTDRRNWVARGQVRLIDRKTGEVVAEYIGFAAHEAPALRTHDYRRWRKTKVCPGKENAYHRTDSAWGVVEFFFREVVQYEDS